MAAGCPSGAFALRFLQIRQQYAGYRRLSTTVTSQQDTARKTADRSLSERQEFASSPDQSRPHIRVPKRIERSPTAILVALAETVGRDSTAAHYRYMDDPFLIPANNMNKRQLALAKESGRRAARYIVKTFPDQVEKPYPEPVVQAFLASSLVREPVPRNPTDADVLARMRSNALEPAVEAWRLMKKQGTPVSPDVEQELLERLCFYNSTGTEPDDVGLLEEQWFAHYIQKEMRPKWKANSPADEIFQSMQDKTPDSYAALICGKAKFLVVDEAFRLFEEMEHENMPVPVDVFNSLISVAHFVRDNIEARWELTLSLLSKMEAHGVKPNLRTLNAVLELISRIGAWRRSREVALQMIAEMRQFGVEPSLGSFNYLLMIFCRERGPVSFILNDLLDHVENNEMTVRDIRDTNFFATAMEVAARHLQDVEVAKRVNRIFGQYQHMDILVDGQKEQIFYGNLLKALLGDPVDEFFRYYDQLVPMVFTPDIGLAVEILRMVEFHDRLDLLPRLWTDLGVFGMVTKESVIDAVMEIMMNNRSEKYRAMFAIIANDIRERLNKPVPAGRNITPQLAWTGQLYGNIATIFARQGDLEGAWQVIQDYLAKRESVLGLPSPAAFNEIIDALVPRGRTEVKKLRQIIELAMDMGFTDVSSRGDEVGEKLSLTGQELKSWRDFIRPGTAQLERTEMDVGSIQQHTAAGV